MRFVLDKKYNELECAILENAFPIIVYGPSGSGKTHTILSILNKHNKKVLHIELETTQLRATLNRNAIFVATLSRASVLYQQINELANHRIIIEIPDSYLNIQKLKETNSKFRAIHFNEVPASRMKKKGYKSFNGNLFSLKFGIKQEEEKISIFRFLGRIFYRRLALSLLQLDGEYITALKVCSNEEIKYKLENKTKSNKTQRGTTRIVESDDEIDRSTKPANEDKPEVFSQVSFPQEMIEAYIYENILLFCDSGNIAIFYELLSCCDVNKYGILACLGGIIQRATKPKGVVQFKSCDWNKFRNYQRKDDP